VLYANKTGTDVNQWYPLEPWMFTTPLHWRLIHESATSWWHLGFLPSLDHIDKSAFEDLGPASNERQKKLQLYHDFLAVLLQEVKYSATNKPVMMINLGGVRVAEKEVAHTCISCRATRSHRTTYVGGSL
jgi:hypothetical protein